MDKEYNILVVGNGFDLFHGLNTRYMDFVNYTKEIEKPEATKRIRGLCYNNVFIRCFNKLANENQQWIDCEKEIDDIVSIFKKIVSDRSVFSSIDYSTILQENTSLFSEEYEKVLLMNPFIKQQKNVTNNISFNSDFFQKYYGINKEKIFTLLKSELDALIFVFGYYLKDKVMNQKVSVISEQIKEINPEYVINFNYTNTYEQYGITRQDVCFIHGSAIDNNMVLGIKDIDEKDINTIYFKKFFQRIQKHTDTIDWSKFSNNTNSHFFGHSLSNTDGDIIRQIYEHSNKILIYYLSRDNDYEKKVINLIDSLGKDIVIEGMYSGRIKFLKIQ